MRKKRSCSIVVARVWSIERGSDSGVAGDRGVEWFVALLWNVVVGVPLGEVVVVTSSNMVG